MNWDEYFLDLAVFVSKKSKDKSTKCGCVIVGPSKEIRSTGYNSFPRGLNDDVESRQERPEKYMWIEHAERNAIYNAALAGISLDGCTIYQDWLPCCDCARAIIQSGIEFVVVDSGSGKNGDSKWDERWGEKMSVSQMMLDECGVELLIYNRETKELESF
jgi:dCMP deaminase